jgi:hypothetical protein
MLVFCEINTIFTLRLLDKAMICRVNNRVTIHFYAFRPEVAKRYFEK